MSFPMGNSCRPWPGRQKQSKSGARRHMRHQLKSKTPSAVARLRYIIREGRYAAGLDGPRNDLRAMGSANLPGWTGGDAAAFWAAADGYERANARRCLELELNLPRELNTRQQIAAVEDYIARLSAEAGPMPCSWAIHNAGDGNPHVHLMLQERPLDGHERTAEQHFKRANRANPERGGALKSQWWHDRENVFWSRALWADACNQALTQGGHEARFDARSKAVRFDEALENGDWLGAVLLSTLNERHEGVAVAGMRRRLERDECWLEDLPDYAQRLIAYNDGARAHNCRLRDWARTATEAELLAYLAPELERRNPGAHVAAWLAAQHVQALDDDRQRAVASALAAGELELRSLAQIEASERAARAAAELADAAAALVELDALVVDEQADQLGALLSIERSQAHVAALIEGAERQRELAELVSGEVIDVTRQRLGIEREQAHSAALIDDAEHERLAFLDVMQKWGAHLGERPEVAQVHALADRLRAGDTGANGAAKELALSLRSAERARQAALEQEEKERQRRAELEVLRRQRVAGMQAEREQQRQAEQDRQVAPSPAPRSGLPAEPEAPETRALERRGGDEWVEFEEGGERYRHPAGRPDEIYWQNPSGEWHLQPGAGESEPDDYETGYDYR